MHILIACIDLCRNLKYTKILPYAQTHLTQEIIQWDGHDCHYYAPFTDSKSNT